MIYLASPYSHPDPKVMQLRYEQVLKYQAMLIKQGNVVYCPIAVGHPMVKLGLKTDWGFWEKQDRYFLFNSSKVVVLKLDGWEKSIGLQAEIKQAEKLDMKIVYVGAE
jgi:hypothetical protein